MKKYSLFSDLDNQSFLNFKITFSYCLYVFLLYFPLEVFKYLTVFHIINSTELELTKVFVKLGRLLSTETGKMRIPNG